MGQGQCSGCEGWGVQVKYKGMSIDVPYEGYMYTHITMYGGTVKADVHAKGDAGPRRVSRLAVDTRLNAPTRSVHVGCVCVTVILNRRAVSEMALMWRGRDRWW